MAGKYNPFMYLYRKFGLKKIIITAVSVFVILLPSILALVVLVDSKQSNEVNSTNSMTVVMYSPEGEELYREHGKTETDSESSLVGIFNVMKKDLSPIDKIPEVTDISTPINIEMITEEGTERLTYYFSFAEGGSYCLWNEKYYRVLAVDSERFLASPYAEVLYSSAAPPSLMTADGETVIPKQVSWYYKNTEGMFLGASKVSVTDEVISYHITGGISMAFVSLPDNCSVEIFDGDELLFSGGLAEAENLTLDSNTSIRIKISAEWSSLQERGFYGTVDYDFNVTIHGRAEFSVSSDTVAKNGFIILKATNIADLSRLNFTCEQLTFAPRFTVIGDTAYAAIPCMLSEGEYSLSFTVTYGVSASTFTVRAQNTEAPNSDDIASSAAHSGVVIAGVQPDFDSPLFLFGTRVSPAEKGYILKRSFGDSEEEYYSYKNEYEYSGVSGMAVSAVCGGKVTFVGSSEALRNYAVVDVGLGISLVYSGMSCIDVSAGELVAVGETVGKTGALSDGGEGFSLMTVFNGIFLDPNILFE